MSKRIIFCATVHYENPVIHGDRLMFVKAFDRTTNDHTPYELAAEMMDERVRLVFTLHDVEDDSPENDETVRTIEEYVHNWIADANDFSVFRVKQIGGIVDGDPA